MSKATADQSRGKQNEATTRHAADKEARARRAASRGATTDDENLGQRRSATLPEVQEDSNKNQANTSSNLDNGVADHLSQVDSNASEDEQNRVRKSNSKKKGKRRGSPPSSPRGRADIQGSEDSEPLIATNSGKLTGLITQLDVNIHLPLHLSLRHARSLSSLLSLSNPVPRSPSRGEKSLCSWSITLDTVQRKAFVSGSYSICLKALSHDRVLWNEGRAVAPPRLIRLCTHKPRCSRPAHIAASLLLPLPFGNENEYNEADDGFGPSPFFL